LFILHEKIDIYNLFKPDDDEYTMEYFSLYRVLHASIKEEKKCVVPTYTFDIKKCEALFEINSTYTQKTILIIANSSINVVKNFIMNHSDYQYLSEDRFNIILTKSIEQSIKKINDIYLLS